MIAVLCALLALTTGYTQGLGLGQSQDPVSWSHSVEKLSDSTYLLIMEAEIEEGWHLYSQYSHPDGALAAEFEFPTAGSGYTLLGPVTESETHVAYNDIFEVDETFFKSKARFTQEIVVQDPALHVVRGSIFYQVCLQVCIPGEREFAFSLDGSAVEAASATVDARSQELGGKLLLPLQNREKLAGDGQGQGNAAGGLWMIFGLGFLGGLIALLTPCVFPMIPLTVSFFTKHSGSKRNGLVSALLYGFSIVLIYFLLSLPFHIFDSVDSQILNSIATNIWLNLFFFAIFLVFAFSFFGYYELTLPASWASRVDSASGKAGGVIGIFFMALTLAIVSFSCTGPILGGLLGSTALAEGNVAGNLTVGMVGFGLALALPFGLFALFPAWLQRLPRSGGWMETVKVVLGFLELGLALKFLSNADLVGHWGILKREVFLGLWLLLSLGLAAYLLGWLRFKAGSPKPRLSPWRVGGSLLSLLFAGYLAYGLVGRAPLTLLSGFPPPDFYTLAATESDCPLGLECTKDFQEGLALSRATGKPMLLDFTGWACVNCRKMEEQVWSNPAVFELLQQKYILVSLYVDDRQPLPQEQQFVFGFENGRTKQINTVGDLWSTFQTVNFGSVSQPFYVQLSPDLQVLNPPMQNTDAASYRDWLASGITNLKAPVGLP